MGNIPEEDEKLAAYVALAVAAVERLGGPGRWSPKSMTRDLFRMVGGSPRRSTRGIGATLQNGWIRPGCGWNGWERDGSGSNGTAASSSESACLFHAPDGSIIRWEREHQP